MLKIKQSLPSFKTFTLLGLLFFLGYSLDTLVSPIYLKEFLKNDNVIGIYVSIRYLIMLITCIYCAKLYTEFSKVRILLITLFIRVLAMIGMGSSKYLIIYIPFDILDIITYSISMIGLGLFIADLSTNKTLAKNEGKYYSISNIGIFLGPIIGGIIAKEYGKGFAFFTAAGANALILIYLFVRCYFMDEGKIHHKKHENQLEEMWKDSKVYFKNKDRVKAFLMSVGLHVWWGIAIYKSLTILNKGFSAATLGVVLGVSYLPLIINEIIVGKKVAKTGIAIFFSRGFLFCGISAISFTLFDSMPFILLIMFMLSNIGASYVEPLQEIYLFKACKVNEREKFLSLFNTAKSLGVMITPGLASIFLTLGGYTTMWLSIAFIMLLFALIATTINEKEIRKS
ncbi:MAG: MFS transporter [Alphaproteobacteria bacterium]|jgi:predicted MFS family arabinose efflux permease|nr:MFS transporter [Alphaproteobacteria bacterium]